MKKIIVLIVYLLNYFFGIYLICQENKIIKIEDTFNFEIKDRWAVIIGISKYKDKNLNLNYSDKDAKTIFSTLKKSCRFTEEHSKILLNEGATRESIRRSIEGWLTKNAKKTDKVLIYFSGHGTQDIDNDGDEIDGYDEFLVPYDYEEYDISSAIRDDDFAKWILNIKSENILIIFDSCYSGGAAKAKGLRNKNIKGEVKADNFVKDIFKEVPKEGITLLGACKADQVSYESKELKQGVFTYFLVNALNDSKTDLDLNKIITIREVYNTIKPNIIKYSKESKERYKNEQEPILIENTKFPFELVLLPFEIKRTQKNDNEKKKIENQLKLTNPSEKEIELLEKLLELDPLDTSNRSSLAFRYFYANNFEKALNHYKLGILILHKYPNYMNEYFLPTFHIEIAKIYDKTNKIDESLANFTEALKYIKNDDREKKANLNKEIGKLFFKKENYDEAIKAYLNSIELDEIQDEVYADLARIYFLKERYDDANGILKKALSINADYKMYYYLQGIIYRYIDKNEDMAIKSFETFEKNNSLIKEYNSLKEPSILASRNRSDLETIKHINRIEEFILEHPFYLEAYIEYIEYCKNLNINREKAESYKNKLISIYPFTKDILTNFNN